MFRNVFNVTFTYTLEDVHKFVALKDSYSVVLRISLSTG